MFGLFSRSNLSFQERVLLVSTLVEAIIVADLADGGWLGVIHRAAIIDQWLKHMNKKAGALLRIGLSGAGKELAQALLSRMGKEDMRAFYHALDGDNEEERAAANFILGQLQDECERMLSARGHAT